jgi:hypothetical protein
MQNTKRGTGTACVVKHRYCLVSIEIEFTDMQQ